MPAEIQRLGTVLEGAYRITRLIGQGGMGAVYEAIQLRLNKRVAVKLMARQLTANKDALARFHREAAITSRLGHPNLVNVIDFGASEDGEPYLVMEYLDGEDLDHRLGRLGPVQIDFAVHITKQTASALGAAHAQGIVHRDLKPANIFLVNVPGEIEFVKVLDFGISKVKAAGVRLTKAAVALGTPIYMSPEQAAGRTDEIDHPTDQWSLACITWEMLCGHTPFVADDVSALFYQVMNLQPQSLLLSVPSLPPESEQVLLRALSKSPKDRFLSIRDFAHAFEQTITGRGADLTPLPVSVARLSTSSGRRDVSQDFAATILAEGRERSPGQLTTFSRTTGEISEALPSQNWANWARLGLKPAYSLVAVAGVVMLIAGIFLLRPRQPSPITTASALRPSIVALPPIRSQPDAGLLPLPSMMVKATEASPRMIGGRAKAKKLHLDAQSDPFEVKVPANKQNQAKTFSPPSDAFHRNDTQTSPSPAQLRVKRTIIKEL